MKDKPSMLLKILFVVGLVAGASWLSSHLQSVRLQLSWSGESGAEAVWFFGPWPAHLESTVESRALDFPGVSTKGGKVSIETGGTCHGGQRPLDTTSLISSGLLSDVSTMWLGAMLGYGSGGSLSTTYLSLALANSRFDFNIICIDLSAKARRRALVWHSPDRKDGGLS